MIELKAYEVQENAVYVESIISALRIVDPAIAQPLKAYVEQFANANKITLNNLLEDEASDLLARMKKLAELDLNTPANKTIAMTELTAWRDKLYHAVSGKGAHVAQHAAQTTGIAANLLKTGKVSLKHWGTDLDILQCLQTYTDPAKQKTDIILPPVSLTESPSFIQDRLQNALERNRDLRAFIPVNCGNNHWRLVKATIKNKEITEIELWDSLKSALLINTSAYKNLETAVDAIAGANKVHIKTTTAGVQNNSYSCMDYVIREALVQWGELDDITDANDPAKLRLAIAKQIASNHVRLGKEIADALEINGDNIQNPKFIAGARVEVDNAEEEKIATDIMSNGVHGVIQVPFDAMLANKLASLYKSDAAADENTLYKKALKETIREFGLFAPKAKPTTPDPIPTPTPKTK